MATALPVAAQTRVLIAEVMAANTRTAKDEDGDTPDWIELWNPGTQPVDVGGMGLSDRRGAARPWRLPSTNIPPSGRLLVWASGKDRSVPGRPLHASFKLSAKGDPIVVSGPGGDVLSEFRPMDATRLPNVSSGLMPGTLDVMAYMPRPTPGAPNSAEDAQPHDAFRDPAHAPATPMAGGTLTVSILARPGAPGRPAPIVAWRRNFEPEAEVPLHDDGRDGDDRAGDGRWTAQWSLAGARDGDLVRWRFRMPGTPGGGWSWPLHADRGWPAPALGTVVNPGSLTSALPVIHLFVEPGMIGRMDSDAGGWGSLFHDGELHDPVLVKVRGNTTAGFEKKSHRVEFAPGQPFRPPHGGGRVGATSFMAEWGDPTYLRQHLCFWLMRRAGVAAPFHEPVRLQRNGAFYQLAMHSLPLGEDLLEQAGLDPRGALYKAVGHVLPGGEGSGGFEKKTRRREGHEDYVALARALGDDRTPDQRALALMELCNVPAVVNYIAVARLCQEDDDIWANLSLYHDNDRSGRWWPVAFDMNVSWGFSYGAGGILADRDDFRSHPFWGSDGIGSNQGHNRLYDAVVRHPYTRAMLVRRMRTLLDDAWRAPGAGPGADDGTIEAHVRAMAARMQPEATLDRARWGEPWTGRPGIPPSRSLGSGVDDLLGRFVDPRRRHFLVTHAETNDSRRVGLGTGLSAGIPSPQPPPGTLRIEARVVEPGGGIHGAGWATVSNTHAWAVDLSGWRVGGGKGFLFPPGSVLPAHESGVVLESWRGPAPGSGPARPPRGSLVLGRWKSLPSRPGPIPVLPP